MRYKLIALSILLILVVLSGCNTYQGDITELQQTACISADKGNTCDTKLADLGIITKEECCQKLGKCC